ncbi:MAG: spore germination protein [Christensenellaceae bacterium]|jgi:spore germination protein KA|nr:spore germination protein [Christensenellaceae bacterium]
MKKTQKQKITAQQRADKFKQWLNDNDDFKTRDLVIGGTSAKLIFLEDIVDTNMLNRDVLTPINTLGGKFDNIQQIMNNFTVVSKLKIFEIDEEALEQIFRGNAALFVDGFSEVICFDVAKFESRTVIEPPTSSVVKGPREGFTESIKTNMGLIRKRLLTTKLKVDILVVGRRTRTAVKIVYLSDVADKKIVSEVKKKIQKIDIDGIIDSFYIAQFLEKRPFSMFKQINSTEKPDVACSKILEGRIAIVVDGSPMVLTVPFLMLEDIQSSNDYYTEPYRAAFLRIMRLFGMAVAILLPGLYVAMELYHYKLLPLRFLTTIVNSAQNLPLSPLLEIFLILILFEMLFEASIRMPKYLGIAISIVGALILGDTAVKAGLVSPPAVMVVAVSGIATYVVPDQSSQISILRLFFTFMGGIMGVQGLMLGAVTILAYLSNFDNYGAPYLAPYSPFVKNDMQDFVRKANLQDMKKRPMSFGQTNKTRGR